MAAPPDPPGCKAASNQEPCRQAIRQSVSYRQTMHLWSAACTTSRRISTDQAQSVLHVHPKLQDLQAMLKTGRNSPALSDLNRHDPEFKWCSPQHHCCITSGSYLLLSLPWACLQQPAVTALGLPAATCCHCPGPASSNLLSLPGPASSNLLSLPWACLQQPASLHAIPTHQQPAARR
jgi:hypothetical protein